MAPRNRMFCLIDLEQQRQNVITALTDRSLSTVECERLHMRLAVLEDAIEATPAVGPDGLMVKWRYFRHWQRDVGNGPAHCRSEAFERDLCRIVGASL